ADEIGDGSGRVVAAKPAIAAIARKKGAGVAPFAQNQRHDFGVGHAVPPRRRCARHAARSPAAQFISGTSRRASRLRETSTRALWLTSLLRTDKAARRVRVQRELSELALYNRTSLNVSRLRSLTTRADRAYARQRLAAQHEPARGDEGRRA